MNELLTTQAKQHRCEDRRLLFIAVLALVAVLLDVFFWRP
jgi:hypothetical protein